MFWVSIELESYSFFQTMLQADDHPLKNLSGANSNSKRIFRQLKYLLEVWQEVANTQETA